MKHKINRTCQTGLLFVLGLIHGSAQSETLTTLRGVAPLEVDQPLAVDSVDQKGNSFNHERLLKLKLTVPEQAAFTQPYETDTAGLFHLASGTEKPFVQLFSFYVHGKAYGKVKVKVVTPALAELFVNGTSVSTKTTAEESQAQAKELSATLAPYPQAARVVVKLFSPSATNAGTTLKIMLENDAKSSAGWLVSHDSKRRIVLDDIIKGKRVSGTSISPQGNYVLISYTESYGKRTSYSTELYHVQTGRRVTIDTDRQKRGLRWMPRTERLVYHPKADERTHLIAIRPETLEEEILAEDIPEESFLISPDEKALFYTKADETDEKPGNIFRMHTLTERAGHKPRHAFIYRYDLATGLTRQLTFGAHHTQLNDVSRDGRYILFSTTEETITERPFRKSSLFRLDLKTMTADTLWWKDRFASYARFSSDGKQLLILGAPESFGGIGLNVAEGQIANSYDTQAFLMDLSTKKIEPITKDFNPSLMRGQWSADSRTIYFQAEDEDRVCLYRYDLNTKRYTRLPSEEEVVNGFEVAEHAPVLAYSGVSLSNSTRAYIYNVRTGRMTRIADPYRRQLSQLTLGEVKNWNFMNSDRTEIKGYYYLPPDFDTTKKYPMIVYYYGGTSPVERRFESRYPMHVYAAMGYVVYVLQPSGATGFGQRFSALHVNTWGRRSSDDIIEGTKKFIAEHPFVDSTKIGCMGASYGGFMTMYLQTRTDMFAAAVSHAGISSISSYWGEGYWGYSYSTAASAGSYPWNNRELYVDQSPLFHADKIKTPILLVHGTADTNVPPGESIQMYTALKILGKPAELLQVEGENHQILDYEKRLKWNESIFAWFEKWLKGDASWWNDLYRD